MCTQRLMTRSAGASKTFATGAGNTLPAAVTRSVTKTPRDRVALIGDGCDVDSVASATNREGGDVPDGLGPGSLCS